MSDLPPSEPPPLIPVEPAVPEAEPELPPLLDKFPLPKYVVLLAVVTLISVLIGAAKAPHVIEMGIKAERGKRDVELGDGEKAIPLLRAVHKEFPFADDITLDLIDADIIEGELEEAVNLLEPFDGKEVSAEEKTRLDSIENKLQEIAAEIDKLKAEDAAKEKKAKEGEEVIPGFLITWVTFPGVIVHELAHALFCRLFGIGMYEVCYFQFSTKFGQPAGYVIHEHPKHAWQGVLVSIGPFFVNSILGAIIAAPATIPVFQFHAGDVLDYFLIWLGVSIAMHSFPSTGDAKSIWQTVTKHGTPIWTKIIGIPMIGLIYIGAVASVFWVDLLYGVAVAGFLPGLIVKLLA